MRALFSFAGGTGHFLPLVAFAQALERRGHLVAVTGQAAMQDVVTGRGFRFFDSGGSTLAADDVRRPLQPVDLAHEERVIASTYAGSVARERAARLMGLIAELQPALIVHDEVDFGAVIAAEASGLPHVGVVVLAAGGLLRTDLVAAPLDALRAEHGLAADPGLLALHRHLTLVPVPPTFRDPAHPLPETARHCQPAELGAMAPEGSEDVLRWLDRHPDRPTIYLTLGTVFPQESGDLFNRALAGLAGINANIVVTTGGQLTRSELGPQPDNVWLAPFIPQHLVLPRADLVVSHAGSGSVIGALAFGVPLLLLPLGADQPLNAARCVDLGVGRVLDPLASAAMQIRGAAVGLLASPQHRAAAAKMSDEIADLPPADIAAGWLADVV